MKISINPDRLYFSSLDPYFYVKEILAIACSKRIEIHSQLLQSNYEPFLCEAALLNYDEFAYSAIRLIRYQATEAFFTILFSAMSHGPTIDFSEKFQGPKFSDLCNQISENTVPKELYLDDAPDFEEWINKKIFGPFEIISKQLLPTNLSSFIVQQALFFGRRASYNAHKHGQRTAFCIKHLSSEIPELEDLIAPHTDKIKHPFLSYKKTFDKKKRKSILKISIEECTPQDDMTSMLHMANVIDAIKSMKFYQYHSQEDRQPEVKLPDSLLVLNELPALIELELDVKDPK